VRRNKSVCRLQVPSSGETSGGTASSNRLERAAWAWFSALTMNGCTCRTSKEPIWIDLTNTSDNFSTPVCKGQKVGWRSTEQFTVTFDNNNKCVDPRMYTVDQTCPGPATTPPTKCSDTTHVKQPSALGIGWCDYKVGGGLTDPRVIIIGN